MVGQQAHGGSWTLDSDQTSFVKPHAPPPPWSCRGPPGPPRNMRVATVPAPWEQMPEKTLDTGPGKQGTSTDTLE